MSEDHIIGLLAPAAVALGWVAIQAAWARAFPEPGADPDVLARRSDCNGCGCLTRCRRSQPSEEK